MELDNERFRDDYRRPLQQFNCGNTMKDRWNDYKNREGMHGARPSSFDPNKISKRKQHQFQNFKQKHHFTRPSVSTAVTTRSVATGAFSVDESRDDSIYVSKITSSGNKRVMYASAETSYSLNSNVIPEGGKNASLASQSTIFHDAISTDPHHHPSHDSPGQYSREARDQHCRYYSDGSIASSQYTSNSYMPQERHMTMSPSHYNDHRWQTYSPINSSNPPKHDTILEDAKPFWSRLKSIFEGEDQTCIEKGLFCNCIEATRSPTPDKFHSYYDGYQNVHNYHSFKDIAPNSVKNDKHSQCQNARTIKKNNAAKVTNDYSLVNLGTAPDHRHEKHHRIESSLYLSSVEHDFNPYDMSLNASPPKEEKSQRRLFQTPSKGWACHEDSPDSIQSEESPMSRMDCRYEYSTSDTDSYAADTDTILSANNTDTDTLGPIELENMSLSDTAYKHVPSSLQDPAHNSSQLIMNEKLAPNPLRNHQRPPLPSSGYRVKDDECSAISPMNTVGTNATLHRRMRSTFSAASLAQIFDTSGQTCLSPEQKKKSGVIPKTVKTVKKNRSGKNDCDGISPLEDDEIQVGFRNRMQDVDVAIDDDSVCSPIHGISKTSFDFSQKMTAMELFGKENVEVEQNVATNDKSQLTLGRKEVLERSDPCTVSKEPEGTYLPISNIFQKEISNGHDVDAFQGWVAYSKGMKTKDDFLDCLRHKNRIKRKHLRYILIQKDFMYVFSSKKPQKDGDDESLFSTNTDKCVKKLKLSKDMKAEVQDISRHHGQCVVLRDKRLKGVRESDVVCTLLPVRLNPTFFQDHNYSQLVESKRFEKIRHSLFASLPTPDNDNDRPILKEIPLPSSKTPHPDENKQRKIKTREWPITAFESVPVEQNTAVLHIQFALDAAKWYRTPKED